MSPIDIAAERDVLVYPATATGLPSEFCRHFAAMGINMMIHLSACTRMVAEIAAARLPVRSIGIRVRTLDTFLVGGPFATAYAGVWNGAEI